MDNGLYAALCAFGAYIAGSILIGWAFLIFFPLWLVVPFLGFGVGAMLKTPKPIWSVMLGMVYGLVGVGAGAFIVLSGILAIAGWRMRNPFRGSGFLFFNPG